MSQSAEQVTYAVPGISCGHCRAAIGEAGYDIA